MRPSVYGRGPKVWETDRIFCGEEILVKYLEVKTRDGSYLSLWGERQRQGKRPLNLRSRRWVTKKRRFSEVMSHVRGNLVVEDTPGKSVKQKGDRETKEGGEREIEG